MSEAWFSVGHSDRLMGKTWRKHVVFHSSIDLLSPRGETRRFRDCLFCTYQISHRIPLHDGEVRIAYLHSLSRSAMQCICRAVSD